MRSELILEAMAHPNCQGHPTMQRLRVAGMNAGECATMAGIHHVQQSLCFGPANFADGDPVGPAMDILTAQPEEKMTSLRCGLRSRGSSSRHAGAHPQARLQAGISFTCSLGNEGGLNVTRNMPSMQDGTVRLL
jgi:hypothetical protein